MIQGFVHALRVQSKIIFIVMRNLRGLTQVVVMADHPSHKASEGQGNPLFELAKNLTLESVIRCTGEMKDAPQAPGGSEMHPSRIEVLSEALPELPIPVVVKGSDEETEAPTRFDYRWLDLRKPEKAKIFKVWTEFEKGWREYWDKEGFIQLYPPSFMSTPSEGGSEVFTVDYFDRKAYLAQSPQFYKQMAMASGLEKVFMVAPVFRAEPSFTTRHMTEFTGWDFEMSYIKDHHDIMDAEEGMVVAGFERLKKVFPELNIGVPTRPFPRISMVETKKILGERGIPSAEEHDVSPEEERALSEYVREKYDHDFVFLMDYHKSKSAFYHMLDPENDNRARRADLIYRGIEVTTMSQREHRPDILEKQAADGGFKTGVMNLEPLKDFVNFFRWGCPPHGGAGVGPARFIMKILDLPNVREATYLPRDVKRLNP